MSVGVAGRAGTLAAGTLAAGTLAAGTLAAGVWAAGVLAADDEATVVGVAAVDVGFVGAVVGSGSERSADSAASASVDVGFSGGMADAFAGCAGTDGVDSAALAGRDSEGSGVFAVMVPLLGLPARSPGPTGD
jgi:hypothetical protein